MAHIYIVLTLVLTLYGHLITKWQMTLAPSPPENLWDKAIFLAHLLLNPWIISSFISTFLAGLSWMMAISKFPISYAYPFVGLNFVLIPWGSYLFFQDQISLTKFLGLGLIVLGVAISSQG